LLADQRNSLAIFLIGGILVRLQPAVKGIQHGNQVNDQPLDAAPALLVPVTLRSLAEILEIRLPADHRLQQFFLFRLELFQFRGQCSFASRRFFFRGSRAGVFGHNSLSIQSIFVDGDDSCLFAFRFRHDR
jgi:hypothetical protein